MMPEQEKELKLAELLKVLKMVHFLSHLLLLALLSLWSFSSINFVYCSAGDHIHKVNDYYQSPGKHKCILPITRPIHLFVYDMCKICKITL